METVADSNTASQPQRQADPDHSAATALFAEIMQIRAEADELGVVRQGCDATAGLLDPHVLGRGAHRAPSRRSASIASTRAPRMSSSWRSSLTS